MSKCLVILSGGMDSTIVLFLAKRRFTEVFAVTFDYGQRHRLEIEAAKKVAELAGVKHRVIELPNVLKSSSPLISHTVGLSGYESYDQMVKEVGSNVEDTFVPMRNLTFLTIAANRAVHHDCDHIGLGICEADTANYPDCTKAFSDLAFMTINKSLGNYDLRKMIKAYTPLLGMNKPQSVEIAHDMDDCWDALAYTHTSYDGLYPPTGKNHSNILRAQGFLDAGYPDPLVLRAVEERLMDLPLTPNYTF